MTIGRQLQFSGRRDLQGHAGLVPLVARRAGDQARPHAGRLRRPRARRARAPGTVSRDRLRPRRPALERAQDHRRRAAAGRRPGARAGHAARGVQGQRHVDLGAEPAPRAATSPRSPPARTPAGISTVFVKSSDGAASRWAQFNPELVAALHANGLRACAWQFVYGNDPLGEASLGADAIADGADCLVIDAETQYEGKYAAAQQYLAALRATVGPAYPIGLTLVPVRRLPPAAALLRLPRPGRRAGEPAAGLLEGHRRHGRRRQRPHARPQPHLRRRDRAARPDLPEPAAGGPRPLPLAVGRLRQRRAVAGGRGSHRRAGLGALAQPVAPPAAPAARPGLAARWPRATRATRWCGCSSTSPRPTRAWP